jgi:hypothetical protein
MATKKKISPQSPRRKPADAPKPAPSSLARDAQAKVQSDVLHWLTRKGLRHHSKDETAALERTARELQQTVPDVALHTRNRTPVTAADYARLTALLAALHEATKRAETLRTTIRSATRKEHARLNQQAARARDAVLWRAEAAGVPIHVLMPRLPKSPEAQLTQGRHLVRQFERLVPEPADPTFAAAALKDLTKALDALEHALLAADDHMVDAALEDARATAAKALLSDHVRHLARWGTVLGASAKGHAKAYKLEALNHSKRGKSKNESQQNTGSGAKSKSTLGEEYLTTAEMVLKPRNTESREGDQ